MKQSRDWRDLFFLPNLPLERISTAGYNSQFHAKLCTKYT